MKVKGRSWFILLSWLTVCLALVYIAIHFLPLNGKQTIKFLSKDEVLYLNDVIDNAKDSVQLKASRSVIKVYFACNYSSLIEGEQEKLWNFIDKSDPRDLKKILPKYPLKENSYFLLYNYWVYLEIFFWCIFGVLCNLLYSTSEYIRKKEFDSLEIFVHQAKLIYTPFCVVIIYLCYNEVSPSPFNISNSYYSISVAFLLGFFSGRMIDFLSRLKDLLLPLSTDVKNGDQAQPIKTNEVTQEILIEAIETHGESWKTLYGVKDVAVGKKKKEGLQNEANCLIFRPIKKLDIGSPQSFIPIPPVILYTSLSGDSFEIITDVQETGGEIVASYSPPTSINKCTQTNVKRLGCSISRLGSNATGSIGLKVYKDGLPHILSCFHVLCAPELSKGLLTFSKA